MKALIDAVEGKLDDGTIGLAALKALIDAVEGKLDLPDNFKADISTLVSRMDFWGDNDDEIVLTTVSSSHNLPNCVVAGLPSGVTIIRVVALIKIALIKDTSGSDNAVNSVTMALKVDATGGYPSTVTAIDIPDNSWAVDVSEATERGGDGMIGDNDIKAEVTGNGTFYGRFENAACDGNNLKFKDIAWGLRIYFTA